MYKITHTYAVYYKINFEKKDNRLIRTNSPIPTFLPSLILSRGIGQLRSRRKHVFWIGWKFTVILLHALLCSCQRHAEWHAAIVNSFVIAGMFSINLKTRIILCLNHNVHWGLKIFGWYSVLNLHFDYCLSFRWLSHDFGYFPVYIASVKIFSCLKNGRNVI